jgi:site-specific DNA-methyltransferase (adenine-specific)
MSGQKLKLDQIIHGDCIEVLRSLPDESVDLIFADPPYNLQLNQELWRPNLTLVDAVDDDWDNFPNFESYDRFSRNWLAECRRVLKSDGSIWVIGSYHNIFRLGYLMQNLGYWFLNDVVWVKTNPMPNFRGVRFTNAHETLIWACKNKQGKYQFNYHEMKDMNGGLQMRSDWEIPLCTGSERLKVNGKKAHSTQKPEALLYRVIVSSSNPGDVVLDPFFGTGTTGAVAKKLNRHWIGIEINSKYIQLANERLASIEAQSSENPIFDVRENKRRRRRIPFGKIVECGLLHAGQSLFFQGDMNVKAVIKPDSNLLINGFVGSIHQTAKHLTGGKPSNGWQVWYYEKGQEGLKPIDDLRSKYASRYNVDKGDNLEEI